MLVRMCVHVSGCHIYVQVFECTHCEGNVCAAISSVAVGLETLAEPGAFRFEIMI